MPSRLNLEATVYRVQPISEGNDWTGGAEYTGTAVYPNMRISIKANLPSQRSQEMGLESAVTYAMTCQAWRGASGVYLYEDDEVTVTFPSVSQFYNWTFKITGVGDPRGRRDKAMLHCNLSRVELARREEY